MNVALPGLLTGYGPEDGKGPRPRSRLDSVARDPRDPKTELPVERSNLAHYKSKSEGRGRVRLFTQDLVPTQQARASVSSDLRQAFERGEFELYYQPQVRLSDGAIAGAEALIRWNHPKRGVLAPAAFIEALESSLIALLVSEWILRTACSQAAEWRGAGHPTFRNGVK